MTVIRSGQLPLTARRAKSPELTQQLWGLRRRGAPGRPNEPGETRTPMLVGGDTNRADCLYCGRREESAMGLIHHWERDCLAIRAVVMLAYEPPDATDPSMEETVISLSSLAS